MTAPVSRKIPDHKKAPWADRLGVFFTVRLSCPSLLSVFRVRPYCPFFVLDAAHRAAWYSRDSSS